MFVLQSFAKINLGLWILGRRPDGFHEIFTPIVRISLCDYIRLKPSKTLRVETSNGIPQEENLVFKGLKRFEELTGLKPDFEIFIEKYIPVGGGLGGGSSNLATVLKWVNGYFGNPLPGERLSELLASLSSDAPSFLCNGVALAEGRGERVKCLKNNPWRGLSVTLFVPEGISSPTALVYSKVEPAMFTSAEKVERLKELLISNPKRFSEFIENPLGDIYQQLYPEVAKDIDFLRKKCYKNFFVSGSGSSFYTLGSLKGCERFLDRLKGRYKIIFLEIV